MLKEKFDVIEDIVVEKQDIRDNFLQLYSCDKYFICPNSTYCYWVGYLLRLGKPYVEVFVPNFNTTLIKNGEQIADVRNWTIIDVDRLSSVNYVASTFENLPTVDNTLTPPTEVRDRMDIKDSIELTKTVISWVGIFFAITLGLGSLIFMLIWFLLFKLFGVKQDRVVGPYYYDSEDRKWIAEINYSPPADFSHTEFYKRTEKDIEKLKQFCEENA